MSKNLPLSDPLLSVSDVSKRYHVGIALIYRAIRDGHLAATQLGKRGPRAKRWLRLSDVDAWINKSYHFSAQSPQDDDPFSSI